MPDSFYSYTVMPDQALSQAPTVGPARMVRRWDSFELSRMKKMRGVAVRAAPPAPKLGVKTNKL